MKVKFVSWMVEKGVYMEALVHVLIELKYLMMLRIITLLVEYYIRRK